jgi:hypothetical protein
MFHQSSNYKKANIPAATTKYRPFTIASRRAPLVKIATGLALEDDAVTDVVVSTVAVTTVVEEKLVVTEGVAVATVIEGAALGGLVGWGSPGVDTFLLLHNGTGM